MKGGLKGIPKGTKPRPEQPLPPHHVIMGRLARLYEGREPKAEVKEETEVSEPVIEKRYLPTLSIALRKADALIAERKLERKEKSS